MSKVVKTSKAGEPSFTLGIDIMKENDDAIPYYIFRSELKRALEKGETVTRIIYNAYLWGSEQEFKSRLTQGKTQRGKKFLQIGCKRFVGVNRTRLIRWANSK